MKILIGFFLMIIAFVVLFFSAVLIFVAIANAITSSNQDIVVWSFIMGVLGALGLLIGYFFYKMANGLETSKGKVENEDN